MAAKKKKHLAAALEALDAKDLTAALPRLLAAWRDVPAVELAEAIDACSRAIRAGQEPLGGKPGRERAERWERLAAQRRPEELERLFEDLVTNAAAESAMRIRRLAADHPRDPRLARWLTTVCTDAPFRSANTATFWTMVAETLVEIADPRSLRGLRSGSFSVSKKLKRAQQKIARQYGEGVPALEEDDARRLAQIHAALRRWAPLPTPQKVVADGAALLAAVYEAPGDVSRRLVYADWLTEQGDPRGEFISLQLQRREGTAAKGSATREKALFTEHWVKWLGGLRHLPRKGLVFEGGFLDTARPSAALEAKHVEWSTCTTLDLAQLQMFESELTRFANTAPLKSLVRVLGLRPPSPFSSAGLATLATTALAKRLEVVGFVTSSRRGDPPPVLSDFAAFTSLKELWWFDPYEPLCGLGEVLRNPVAKRLEAFRAENDAGDVFTLRRTAGGRLSALHVTLAQKWLAPVGRALAAVQPGWLEELRVTATVRLAPGESRDALRSQLERLKLAVVELP